MNCRVLNLNALTKTFIRVRIIFVYIVITMNKECPKTTFSTRCRFITSLIIH